MNSELKESINSFHKLYYDSNVWRQTYFAGCQILKCPHDLWIYQEIITELKPDVIIETGTYSGGSALYMAHICDFNNHGRILSVDILKKSNFPVHPRVRYITGSSTSEEVISQIRSFISSEKKVMVVLDSDHSRNHVFKELQVYSPLVTVGSYLIVEDTNINGHPVLQNYGAGPMEAVQEFIKDNDSFVVDSNREKFFLTFNPSGYLKKIK